MTTKFTSSRRQPLGAIALAILVAATAVGCAQLPSASADDQAAVSGSSVPGINYHAYPYNLQVGP